MTSTAVLRRLGAIRSNAKHSVIPLSIQARAYATEEVDPQLNGYPQLPAIPRANLPPLGWFDNLTRRNFGETIHEQEETLSMWGPDAPPIAPTTALRQFILAVAGFVTIGFTIKAITPDAPVIRREYPYNGLVKELGGLEVNKARTETVDTEN